jgi:hypothetical protein
LVGLAVIAQRATRYTASTTIARTPADRDRLLTPPSARAIRLAPTPARITETRRRMPPESAVIHPTPSQLGSLGTLLQPSLLWIHSAPVRIANQAGIPTKRSVLNATRA